MHAKASPTICHQRVCLTLPICVLYIGNGVHTVFALVLRSVRRYRVIPDSFLIKEERNLHSVFTKGLSKYRRRSLSIF